MKTHRKKAAGDDAAIASVREEAPRWRSWSVQVALVAAIAAVLYVALASFTDLRAVADAMRTFPREAALRVAALVAGGLALRALRWHLYARAVALGVPAGPSVLAFVAGFAFTATPGKAGEILKSFLLKRRYGASVSLTAGILVVERLTDLLAVLLLAVAGLERPMGQEWVLAASALALAAAIGFLASERLQSALLRRLARVRGLDRLARGLPALLGSSRSLSTPGKLAMGVALATVAWSCEALALETILDAVGADVPRSGAFFAFAAASLLGVLSMLPGGLGGFEASMVLVLGELDVATSTAVAATLLFRLATLWSVTVAGLLALAAWMVLFGRGARRPG